MSRKINAEKAQKMNLMLAQAVTAMRVNERLMCRLLRWAASHSDNPRSFIEKTLEEARDDLRQADDDSSSTCSIATNEALSYLNDLATEIITAQELGKRSPRKILSVGIHTADVASKAGGSSWQQ